MYFTIIELSSTLVSGPLAPEVAPVPPEGARETETELAKEEDESSSSGESSSSCSESDVDRGLVSKGMDMRDQDEEGCKYSQILLESTVCPGLGYKVVIPHTADGGLFKLNKPA